VKLPRRAQAALAAIAVLIGGGAFVLFIAPAANAAPPCPAGAICFYKDFHFLGSISTPTRLVNCPLEIRDFRHSRFWDGSSLNDNVSSVINNSNRVLFLYYDTYFRGKVWKVPHQGGDRRQNVPWDLNDRFSSARTWSGQGPRC